MKKLNKKQYLTIGTTIATLLLLLYIVSRFGHIITGPRILLDDVPDNPITTSTLQISGTIKGGRLFWINQAQTPIEKNGRFTTQLVVPAGYTIITLEAEDELGSRRTKTIPIYYLPPTEEPSVTPITNEQ